MNRQSYIIEAEDLSRSYGKVKALDHVSLNVRKGELYGLIGPDGAGKTTLFRILATLLTPDGGHFRINGWDGEKDMMSIRSSIGYMPGKFSLYPDLTVEENLEFFASIFGVRVKENLDLIEPIFRKLEPFKKRKAGQLSGGMKQKLALSCAMIHKPDILFLDEPTTGVDAVSRTEFWEMLDMLRNNGITILVSTPYMDEADRCVKIALMNQGHIMMEGSPEKIRCSYPDKIYAITSSQMYLLLQTARRMEGVVQVYPFGSCHHLCATSGFDTEGFLKAMHDVGLEDVGIMPEKVTIEDVFIALMGRKI